MHNKNLKPLALASFPVILAFASLSACATAKPAPAGTCVVEAKYLMGGRVAHVDGTSARIPGLLADRDIASYENGKLVWKAGLVQLEGGEIQDNRLVLTGLLTKPSEPIADGKVRVSLPLGQREFAYNEHCTVEEAALGAFAILKMEDEDIMTAAAAE